MEQKLWSGITPTTLKYILCLFLRRFANWNLTQLNVWFSHSEVVLYSNASNDRKILRIRQRRFLRMIGKYGSRLQRSTNMFNSKVKTYGIETETNLFSIPSLMLLAAAPTIQMYNTIMGES